MWATVTDFAGAARVYTAAHYPHDLVAGMLIGAGVVLICYVLVKKPVAALLKWLERTPLRVFLGGSEPAEVGKE